MSRKDKIGPGNKKTAKEELSDEDSEQFDLLSEFEEEDSGERKYWEKYFEEEDELYRQKERKKLKKKGKFKNRDFE